MESIDRIRTALQGYPDVHERARALLRHAYQDWNAEQEDDPVQARHYRDLLNDLVAGHRLEAL